MYQKCPKCGHARAPEENDSADVCAACGLIFSKYLKSRFAPAGGARSTTGLQAADETTLAARAKALVCHVPEQVDAVQSAYSPWIEFDEPVDMEQGGQCWVRLTGRRIEG